MCIRDRGIHRFFPGNIFVYADFVQPTSVGNIDAQILRSFSPKPNVNKYTSQIFDFKEGKMLNVNLMDQVRFKLRTDWGTPVEFVDLNAQISLILAIQNRKG